jgi:hypothetical protein
MKKIYFALFMFLSFAIISCEDNHGDMLIFYNFSPQDIIDISIYKDNNGAKGGLICNDSKTLAPYNYTTFDFGDYDIFIEVKTADGNTYISKSIWHSGNVLTDVILSVHYEIVEYRK